jgi:hypothetical protein
VDFAKVQREHGIQHGGLGEVMVIADRVLAMALVERRTMLERMLLSCVAVH